MPAPCSPSPSPVSSSPPPLLPAVALSLPFPCSPPPPALPFSLSSCLRRPPAVPRPPLPRLLAGSRSGVGARRRRHPCSGGLGARPAGAGVGTRRELDERWGSRQQLGLSGAGTGAATSRRGGWWMGAGRRDRARSRGEDGGGESATRGGREMLSC
ncbi:hypothetical protein SETIT_5G089900v2 [Setaria italica]|uniref:Uncharacterized protein n=1 Tax=Setaria italica TaxID=4555 RepID=A0A368R4M5_SETIT|nr:hypothetical protein SETIT_5G089900v2 [Setaria italica]